MRPEAIASEQHLLDRLQRADSWIRAASGLRPDQKHEAFIFLSIALNCLYGRRQYEGDETRIGEDLEVFLTKIQALHEKDRERGGSLLTAATAACRKEGAALIRDKFLVNRYWRGEQPPAELQDRLNRDAALALTRLGEGSSREFLALVFRRIAVLRNQIMHGCATYGPRSFGRASLDKGLRVLRVMVPAFYQLISRHGQAVKWEPVPYPRWGSPHHPHR